MYYLPLEILKIAWLGGVALVVSGLTPNTMVIQLVIKIKGLMIVDSGNSDENSETHYIASSYPEIAPINKVLHYMVQINPNW